MSAALQVEGLTKHYGSYIGIEDVSFSVEPGEVVGFLGPNGAGKTTTMRILTCSMPATRGQAIVAGFDVMRDSLEVRRRVGYLPEAPPLYSEMTVVAYLKFVATIKGVPKGKLLDRLDYALHACGIRDMTGRIAGQLSKGYRQRVGIAQALIHDPSVLIFDEPTSGLDPGQIIEIRDLIRDLGRERTVILSTHLLSEAQMTCRRLLVINLGRMAGDIELDERGELVSIKTPTGAVEYETVRALRVEFVGGSDALEASARNLPGVLSLADETAGDAHIWTLKTESGSDLRADLAALIVGSGARLLELREARPTLEQVFLDLTRPDAEPKPAGAAPEPHPDVSPSPEPPASVAGEGGSEG